MTRLSIVAALLVGLAACGGTPRTAAPLPDPPADDRTEIERRIARCWQPYHAAVARAIDAAHTRHGYSLHINCHSMPAVASSHATDFPGLVHADFVVGDRDQTTASAALGRRKPRLWPGDSARRIASSGCSKPQPLVPSAVMHENCSASVPL